MKNNKKKSSTARKLLPAFAMLTVSAISLSTSTYAWFSMSKDVSVTGMKLKATAEDGLVISDYTKTNWATSKTIVMNNSVALAPTSTSGALAEGGSASAAGAANTWASSTSRYFDNADKNHNGQQGAGAYTDLTFTYDKTAAGVPESTVSEGVGKVDSTQYVLLRKFYIKSTGNQAWAANLVIDEVTASASGGASANLDKSLRVLVVAGTDSFIYAPIEGYDNECKFKGTGVNNLTLVPSTTDSTCSSITSIPAGNTETPIEVCMYMYFEGEDQNCKSSNISGITVDDLTISAKFKTTGSGSDSNNSQQGGGDQQGGGSGNGEGGN